MNESDYIAYNKQGEYCQITASGYLEAARIAEMEYGERLGGIHQAHLFAFNALRAELQGKPIVKLDNALRAIFLAFIWGEMRSIENFCDMFKIPAERAWEFIDAQERELGRE